MEPTTSTQPPEDFERSLASLRLDGGGTSEERGISKQKVTALLGRIYDVLPPDVARSVRDVAQSQLATYAYSDDLEMVKLLLDVRRYANYNEEGVLRCQDSLLNGLRVTPLSAAVVGGRERIVTYLLGTGRCSTSCIETAYLRTCRMGTLAVLELFMGQQINFHVRSKKLQTGLHLAVLSGDKEKVKRLLEAGIVVEIGDEVEKKAYDYPFDADDGEMYKLFFLHGRQKLDIKKIDGRNRTFLHYAAEKGKKNVVSALLDLGVDPNVRSKRGRTAYQIALDMKHFDVANILRPTMSKDALLPPQPSGLLSTVFSWGRASSQQGLELVPQSPPQTPSECDD